MRRAQVPRPVVRVIQMPFLPWTDWPAAPRAQHAAQRNIALYALAKTLMREPVPRVSAHFSTRLGLNGERDADVRGTR